MSTIYEPLDTSRREIRLLRIKMSEDKSSLRGSLFKEVLGTTKTKYSALSYVWGDVKEKYTIDVDGETIAITENLYWAFRAICDPNRPKSPEASEQDLPFYLWVDAICINQQDLGEKSFQIPLMRDIYQSAERVIAYLGRGTEDSTLALKTIHEHRDKIRQSAYEDQDFEWMQPLPQFWERTDDVFGNSFWKGLKYLGDAQFWTRIWIVQELVLAKEVFFLTNHNPSPLPLSGYVAWNRVHNKFIGQAVPRPSFFKASLWSALSQMGSPGITALSRVYRTRFELAKSGYRKLAMTDVENFSRLSSRLLASDPKDKIYGLLALLDLDIEIDYSEATSVSKVYSSFARKCVEAGTSSDVLSHCGIGWNLNSKLRVPSWVPDWQALSTSPYYGSPINMALWNSCYWSAQGIEAPKWRVRLEDNSLVTNGCCIERIQDVGTIPFPAGDIPVFPESSVISKFCFQLLTGPQAFRNISLRDLFRMILRDVNPFSSWEVSSSPQERLYQNPANLEGLVEVIVMFLGILLEMKGITNHPDGPRLFLQKMQSLGWDFFHDTWQEFLCREFFPGHQSPDLFKLPPWVETSTEPESAVESNDVRDLKAIITRRTTRVLELVTWATSYPFERYMALQKTVILCLQGSRILQLPSGALAITPPDTLSGDLICVLNYHSCPVVLRQDGPKFDYVGGCYVHGYMNGEAADLISSGKSSLQEFVIR